MALTDVKVRNSKPKEKQVKLFDADGLFLLIAKSGGKCWRLKYRFGGKEKLLALGTYPGVSLADARQRRDAARKLLASGVDPSAFKKAQKIAEKSKDQRSFEVIARAWHQSRANGWAESHAKTTLDRLEKNVFPWLGALPMSEIRLSDLKPVLHRVEERAPESARRILTAISMIFRYSIASGFLERNPLEGLKPNDIMKKEPIQRHFPAITTPHDLGALLRSIDDFSGTFVVKCALKLAPLLLVRPGELRHAQWKEIDLELGEWNIPIERMKLTTREKIKRKGDFHSVPLSRQAVRIFLELQPLTGRSPYVFPSARSYQRPMSEAALTAALHRMGYQGEMTWHGFRATARTVLDEVLGVRVDFIEHQLAHAVRDPLGRSYNRTSHLDGRRKMMQDYSDYLEGLKEGTKTVSG